MILAPSHKDFEQITADYLHEEINTELGIPASARNSPQPKRPSNAD